MDHQDHIGPSARMDGAALLAKACDVLDAVAAQRDGIGQAELAARLGLPRTTLYRILAGLVARGLLRQDPARRVYSLGFRLLEMAQGVWSTPNLPAAAAPELRQLRDMTGETAYVAALEGRDVLSLGKYEGAHERRSAARLGERKPLHCTSQGKAILAFLPEAERDALLKRLPLKPMTPHTLTDRRRLAAALRIVRARGFATDDEEIALGTRCVGAPVLDGEGRVLGAVSIAGPAWRMTVERLELLGPEVAAAGRRIGAQLRPAEEPPLPAGAAAAVVPGGAAAFLGLAPRWTPEGGGLLWWADALAAELRCVTGGRIEPVAPWNAALRGLAPAAGARPEVLAFDALGAATRIGQDGTQRARRVLPAAPLVVRTHPGGALWAAMEKDGASMIGPLRPDGTLSPAWRLPGHVRALAWAAGGRALYAATPDTGCIHRLEDGRAAPLLLARMPSGAGRPAGLAVDADGGLWVALHDGWSVARLGHDGEVERVLPLPVPRPTDLGFGGPGLATLYIATARDGLGFDTLAAAPLSGRLLTAMPGVQGLPEAPSDWL